MAESERLNPDSYYWQNETRNVKLALIDAMGDDEFLAYAESIFPDNTIEDYTWKQIHDTYFEKLKWVVADRMGKGVDIE